MTRVMSVIALLAVVLAAPLAAGAQPAGKVHRMGFLGSGSATGDPRAREAFRDGLRELGWIEGQTLLIEYRFADGKPERLPALAAELVALKVDVIVASNTPLPCPRSKRPGLSLLSSLVRAIR